MIMQFVVNLILARLLLPSDFGAIGLIYIFLAVSQTLIDGGFGAALIQNKQPSQTDYSTIFYWNLMLASLLYISLFISAPLIARFYKLPELIGIIRVIGLSLIVDALSIIQQNKLRKQLEFKKLAIVTVLAYALGAAVALFMAYSGAGVWALVANTLGGSLFMAILVWLATRWLPSLTFSRASLRNLFGFGGYLLASNILQTVCQNLQGLIIGRRFSATQMGYYSQAAKLDNICSYSIPQIIIQVVFPVFSSLQDDYERIRKAALKVMGVIAHLIFPLMALLILIAEPLITGLYGEKWLPSVPYFRILCVGGIFVCLQNVNFYVVASVGKSRALFFWSFYKWGFLIAALLTGMFFGMTGLLWGMVISSFNIYLTNAWLSAHFVGLKVSRQLLTLLPTFLLSGSLLASCFALHIFLDMHYLINAAIFILAYILLSHLLKIPAYIQTIEMLIQLIHRKKSAI